MPGLQGNARRARILPIGNLTKRPLQLIHIDISGPVTQSIAGNRYTLAVLDYFSGMSELFMLRTKYKTHHTLEWHNNRPHTEFNNQLILKNSD